jgi:hypothetical protein
MPREEKSNNTVFLLSLPVSTQYEKSNLEKHPAILKDLMEGRRSLVLHSRDGRTCNGQRAMK